MQERTLNASLEGKMDAHLSVESRENDNRSNGQMSKTVQTQYVEVAVETPRDLDGSFEPQTVRSVRQCYPKHGELDYRHVRIWYEYQRN